jgi:crotonobetainyl-CoA:carnitine CoA-transferase CaiB-like acyl-CoA transferase
MLKNRHVKMNDGVRPSYSAGALDGIRVLDLSRVLAGPWATQILGDFGAEVLKVERPGQGDDTRGWGPPFVGGELGVSDAAYFTCCNRNKEALAIDFSRPEGAALIRRLARDSDILVENFRVGHLKKYGLDYDSLRAENPRLIYCSVTGFGQVGPYADRGGYDFLIQGMSGLMSVTGNADNGDEAEPLKVGVPVSDLFTGLYTAVSSLVALNHRHRTGEGQHVDCALLDSQLATLANQAAAYLMDGKRPKALGNQHPSVVPYRDFETADGRLLVTVANDTQFRKFCSLLGFPKMAEDARFQTNRKRNINRRELEEELASLIKQWPSEALMDAMEIAGLPCGPVNTIDQILADPHVLSRDLVHTLYRDDGTAVRVVGYPHRLSRTPASYRIAPPRLAQDTRKILAKLLGLSEAELDGLEANGTIANATKA